MYPKTMFLRLHFSDHDKKLAIGQALRQVGFTITDAGPLIEIPVPVAAETEKRKGLRLILAYYEGWTCVGPSCQKGGHFMVSVTQSYAWGTQMWKCVEAGCEGETRNPLQTNFMPMTWFIKNLGMTREEYRNEYLGAWYTSPALETGRMSYGGSRESGRLRTNEPNNLHRQIPRERPKNYPIQGTAADLVGIDYAKMEQEILLEFTRAIFQAHAADLRKLTRALLTENWQAVGVYLQIVSKFATEFETPVLLAAQSSHRSKAERDDYSPSAYYNHLVDQVHRATNATEAGSLRDIGEKLLKDWDRRYRNAAKSASFVDAFAYGRLLAETEELPLKSPSDWYRPTTADQFRELGIRPPDALVAMDTETKSTDPKKDDREIDATEAELLKKQIEKMTNDLSRTKNLESQILYDELEKEADSMFRFLATLNLQDHSVAEQREANKIIQGTKQALLRLRASKEKKGG